MGYTDSERREGKPLLGIANSWNTLVPGHYSLDKVAAYVKNGIYAGGGRIRAGDMVGIRYEGRLELHASADQGAIIKM